VNTTAIFGLALVFVPTTKLAAQDLTSLVASPAVRAIATAPMEYRQDRLDDFWLRIATQGTPLIEPLAVQGQSLVTFVYRGNAQTQSVQFVSGLNALHIEGIVSDFGSLGTMHRVPDTDVWFLSFEVGDDLRATYSFAVTDNGGAAANRLSDPLNPRSFAAGTRWEKSALQMPDAPSRPWLTAPETDRPGYTEERLESTSLGGEQSFWVSWPEQCTVHPEDCNIFIAMDPVEFGVILPTTTIVEYLTAKGFITPTAVVLTNDLAASDDADGYGPAASFIADELLPALRQRYGATRDPSRVVLGGASRKGLISAYVGWARPEAVGNVLSLSGSYYWRPRSHAEPEWLPSLYAAEAAHPIKLYLAVGFLETVVTPGNGGHYMVGTNRHMRDILTARQYEYEYVEFNGIHSDYNWHDNVAAGLKYLLNKNNQIRAASSARRSS
jgi:enterochelin esterase-like enzyme